MIISDNFAYAPPWDVCRGIIVSASSFTCFLKFSWTTTVDVE